METKTQEKATTSLTPKDLVSKLGIEEKEFGHFCASGIHVNKKSAAGNIAGVRQTNCKRLQSQGKSREADRQAKIKKQLSGNTNTEIANEANDTTKGEIK